MRIRVDHRTSRQLIDGGPWIFWRGGPTGAREGLALELVPCANRQCQCRDVRAIGHVVGEDLREIEATRQGLVFTYDGTRSAIPDPPAASALVSFETGEVEPDTAEPDTADDIRIRAWIADELDGDLLDRLHDEWLHAKAWRRRDTYQEFAWATEWRSDPSRLVCWHEAFPDSRQDMYPIDGSVVLVLDHYCINPSCHCRDVHVALLASGRRRRWTQFGEAVFDLDSPGATRLLPGTPSKAHLVGAVRDALEKRYDVFQHFSARMARLREVGTALEASARPAPAQVPVSRPATPGRNAPCPCGSGRKYKHCCLNRG